MHKVKINEIFDSIQGEGPYIGYRQIFIRFCGCNVICEYCDTEYTEGIEYTVQEVLDIIDTYDYKSIHSISLTGGEPLIHYEFLQDFLPGIKSRSILVFLETNGLLVNSLQKIIDYVDIISMDIKLDSSSKIGELFNDHKKFIEKSQEAGKEIFAKIVFDDNIREFEIHESLNIGKEYNIPLILQPKMKGKELAVSQEKMIEVFKEFTGKHHETRLIGQTHKFLGLK